MEQVTSAAMFFTASILIGLGCIAIAIFVIVINNLIARFWKYLGWFKSWNFNSQAETVQRVEPVVNNKKSSET
jgi:hypothetical protein